MGRTAVTSEHCDSFAVDDGRALAELELAWAFRGYHRFSADSTWCAIDSTGEVLTGGNPDTLDRAIRAYRQAMQ